jgi:DNA-binding transcriptional regulator YdaS (Cro superfamily)
MEAHGETQTGLAARLGIKQSAVGQWLAGTTRPAHPHRSALERLTGIEAHAWETAKERRAREAVEARIPNAIAS